MVPVSVTPWFQRLLALKDGKHKTMVRRDLVVAVNNVPASESWSCCATAKVASDSSSGATTAESGRVIRRESKNEKRRKKLLFGDVALRSVFWFTKRNLQTSSKLRGQKTLLMQ